ncbi:MAG: di-trans,poly-cis-decaprenylcistransferase [Candidatus Solincola sediminis]|uniref:Isoprenyl transferase n=1 Tax=Candidatus Solincola sediminis TaxID=1797199 RepID=A0A1F2WPY0_9ACTN|nr:MAG: di-trans,poly-cis-decaprenylcistransferase [Candidatus Solincola sediminis]OFW58932.1 MAG: di-trans,poly-cis-decaprenylcistransferase [Candidatus Solincola sediminis]
MKDESKMQKPSGNLPGHIAIIMDGNGRWATGRNLPRVAGHKAGEEAITDIIRVASEWELGALSLFAFSTENWDRPDNEVQFLMSFNRNLLNNRIDEFHERNIRIKHLGRRDPIPDSTLEAIDNAMEKTMNNTGTTVCIAFNYGGRAEIVDAARKLYADVSADKVKLEDMDEVKFRNYLYIPDVPDPDLLIRTAGEMRISNFMIWELAYSEIYMTEVLWPDFRREHLARAIEEYQSRERRFGSIREE